MYIHILDGQSEFQLLFVLRTKKYSKNEQYFIYVVILIQGEEHKICYPFIPL